MSATRRLLMGLAAAVLLLAAACGGDDEPGNGGTQSPQVTGVAVTLREFSVAPASSSGPGGRFRFDVTNEGPEDQHEFVVIKTDLAPEQLPAKADGSVDEDGQGIQIIDEIEEFAPGSSMTLSVDLAAGKYVFICNLVEMDAGKTEAHYQLGMRATFTVA